MEQRNAKELFLKNRRFDLIYKIMYAENMEGPMRQYYEDIYARHIYWLNRFYEEEPAKNSREDFVNAFRNLYFSMKENGFDKNNPLPVNEYDNLENGAHRLACAYVLGIPVYTDYRKFTKFYDYKLFQRRGMPPEFSDIGARGYVEHNERARVILLMPQVPGVYDRVIEETLNKYGFVYYMRNLGQGFAGIDDALAVLGKRKPAFFGFGCLRYIVFNGDDEELLRACSAVKRITGKTLLAARTNEESVKLINILCRQTVAEN